MAHKFNPTESWKLDNPERRRAMPPGATLVELGLKQNDVFVDIGCGTGYFTIPAVDIVGAGGCVYGLDTSQEMLDMLKSNLGSKPPSTLHLVRTAEYKFNLDPGCASFAFMCNVLHEVDDPGRFIAEVRAILGPGGRFALIDWVKKRSDFGPPEEHRLDHVFVEQLLAAAGFEIGETRFMGGDFFSLVSVSHQ
jgi:ubiquinone/menaquinone biosynthesis C-methylase UbiE